MNGKTPLELLGDAIKQAHQTGHVIDCGPVTVEVNYHVVFYFIGDDQVSAADALEALDAGYSPNNRGLNVISNR
ncbi:hypothetical protein AB9R83_15245 (plasmid) [Oceanimonas smirnovii]|uniref:hypothetical protein n=1 Tax=Oceanimonas smirnovii TaxID=264574 RepID=UPI003AABB241